MKICYHCISSNTYNDVHFVDVSINIKHVEFCFCRPVHVGNQYHRRGLETVRIGHLQLVAGSTCVWVARSAFEKASKELGWNSR